MFYRENNIRCIEDLREAVLGSSLHADQIGSKPIQGRLRFVALNNGAATFGTFRGDVHLTGLLSETDLNLGVLLHNAGGCRQWYRAVESDDLGIFPAGSEHNALYSKNASYAALTVSGDYLLAFAEREGLPIPSTMLQTKGVFTKASAARQVCLHFLDLLDRDPQLAFTDAYVEEAWDRLMLAISLRLHQEKDSRRAHLPPLRNSEQLVRAAIAYLSQNGHRPVTVSELSRHFAVPRRSLYRAFVGVTSHSPSEFVLFQRLNGVRRTLLHNPPVSSNPVTTAAFSWGFGDLSRFAGQYRRLFGERPSHTIARNRVRRRGETPRLVGSA